MGSSTNEAVQENLALSLSEFFVQANTFSHEVESKAKEQLALAEELALAKEQHEKQAQGFFIRETALNQELSALRQAKLEANKKLHDKGQEYTTLLGKVVPLRTQVVELQEEAATSKAKRANLEEQSVDREVQLGKVEAKLTAKAEALEKAKEELTLRAEDFEKDKAELLDDVVDAYAAGFEDALA